MKYLTASLIGILLGIWFINQLPPYPTEAVLNHAFDTDTSHIKEVSFGGGEQKRLPIIVKTGKVFTTREEYRAFALSKNQKMHNYLNNLGGRTATMDWYDLEDWFAVVENEIQECGQDAFRQAQLNAVSPVTWDTWLQSIVDFVNTSCEPLLVEEKPIRQIVTD